MKLRFRPELQTLENRCLLANNVTATLSGGNLTIVGDDEANYINVFQVSPGTVAVVSEFETTVNGEPANPNPNLTTLPPGAPYVFSGVTGDLTISLRGGDDALGLYLDVGDDLTVNLGTGIDFVGTVFFDVPRWVQPSRPIAVEVFDDTLINAGDGDDVIFMGGNRFHDDFTLNAGEGNDFIDLANEFLGDVTISLGGGSDILGLFSAVAIGDDLTISGGSGDDSVSLFDLVVSGDAALSGGSGFDTLTLSNCVFNGELCIFGFEQTQ